MVAWETTGTAVPARTFRPQSALFVLPASGGPAQSEALSENSQAVENAPTLVMVAAGRYTWCVCIVQSIGAWLSLVERTVRDREVGGSNPLAPTTAVAISRELSGRWR